MGKFHARHKQQSNRYCMNVSGIHFGNCMSTVLWFLSYVPGGLLMAGCMVSNVSDIVPLISYLNPKRNHKTENCTLQ